MCVSLGPLAAIQVSEALFGARPRVNFVCCLLTPKLPCVVCGEPVRCKVPCPKPTPKHCTLLDSYKDETFRCLATKRQCDLLTPTPPPLLSQPTPPTWLPVGHAEALPGGCAFGLSAAAAGSAAERLAVVHQTAAASADAPRHADALCCCLWPVWLCGLCQTEEGPSGYQEVLLSRLRSCCEQRAAEVGVVASRC